MLGFKLLMLSLFLLPGSVVKEEIRRYIDAHSEIAVSEMHRTGIPASIKLAQALLESSYGKSELSSKANNHFGIKCGSSWSGPSYKLEDDDYRNGKLIKSCFRKYDSAYESFIAHSDFLADSKKKYRYGFLFRYDSSDYESWAYGLYDAGYATDPRYPEKLISLIEKYELYQYDGQSAPIVRSNKKDNRPNNSLDHRETAPPLSVPAEPSQSDDIVIDESEVQVAKYRKKNVNQLPVIVANHQETLLSFAKRNSLRVDDLMKFNERFHNSAEVLTPGEYVFLEEKRNSYDGKKEEHKVKEGESVYFIAQKYGIKLKSLYAKNRLPIDAEVMPGERLSLKGRIKLGDRPEFILNEGDIASADKFLF